MVSVTGKIIGTTQKQISPRQGGKQFDPFTIYTYFIQDDDGGRPTEVQSSVNSRKNGQKVDLPVYVRTWGKGDRHGFQLREIEPK